LLITTHAFLSSVGFLRKLTRNLGYCFTTLEGSHAIGNEYVSLKGSLWWLDSSTPWTCAELTIITKIIGETLHALMG
jgi:hypothetical protein